MLEIVKKSLRIKTDAYNDELKMLIGACERELSLAGIGFLSNDDMLHQNAVTMYCKAHFGENDKAERWQKAYDSLKDAMALSSDYGVTRNG